MRPHQPMPHVRLGAHNHMAGSRRQILSASLRRARPRLSWSSYAIAVSSLISLNFFLPRLMPGDPLTLLTAQGSPVYVTPETKASLRHYYGLDLPMVEQFRRYLTDLVHGDLGMSVIHNKSVTVVIAERLPWTLLLVGTALVVATAVGWLAGIASAWRRGALSDRGLLVAFLTLSNLPAFFIAPLVLLLFVVKLRWFPLAGATTPFATFGLGRHIVDIGYHLVLPATVLAVLSSASSYLVMRASMVAQIGADYMQLGYAKGLPERRLKYRYAARNALLPATTATGLQLGQMVTGAVFIESVFAYPGMGRLMFDSIAARDYPALQGCFLVLTVAVLTFNALADAVYSRLDPRTSA